MISRPHGLPDGPSEVVRWQSRPARLGDPYREEVRVTTDETERLLDGVRITLVRELVDRHGDRWEPDDDLMAWRPWALDVVDRPLPRYRWVLHCRKCYGFNLDVATQTRWRAGLPPVVDAALVEHLSSYGHALADAVERVRELHRVLGVPLPEPLPGDVIVDTCPVCGALVDLDVCSVSAHIATAHP